jgi:hypothetical protein
MNPRLFLPALLAASCASAQPAAPDAAPAKADNPPAAATDGKTEMQKWIEATDAQWLAAFQRDVTDVREAEARKLMLQYLNLLEDAIGKASKAGDLPGAVALREEEKRFGDTQLFPGKDDVADTTAAGKEIRTAIRAHLAKLETDAAARAKALHAKYDQILAQAQTQLTQLHRLDDALLVKTKREQVAAAWIAPAPAAAQKATPPAPPPVDAANRLKANAPGKPDKPSTSRFADTKWRSRSGRSVVEFRTDGKHTEEWNGNLYTGKWHTISDTEVRVRRSDQKDYHYTMSADGAALTREPDGVRWVPEK